MAVRQYEQSIPRDSAATRLWSLAPAGGKRSTESPLLCERELIRWTCARCGAVVKGIGAAADHIELHRSRDRARAQPPLQARPSTGRRPGRAVARSRDRAARDTSR